MYPYQGICLEYFSLRYQYGLFFHFLQMASKCPLNNHLPSAPYLKSQPPRLQIYIDILFSPFPASCFSLAVTTNRFYVLLIYFNFSHFLYQNISSMRTNNFVFTILSPMPTQQLMSELICVSEMSEGREFWMPQKFPKFGNFTGLVITPLTKIKHRRWETGKKK